MAFLSVPFPRHRFERGPAVVLGDQRGRLVTSHLPEVAASEVATQTGYHDAHNHSAGPGYSPTQVFDFSRTLADGVMDQMALLDAAGVGQVLWMPIPTNIEGGPLAACCGNQAPSLGRTYYLPDEYRDGTRRLSSRAIAEISRVPQYYNLSVDWQVAKAWSSLPPVARERMLPALTGINLADPHAVHGIMRIKREYPDVFHWAGEATVCKGGVDQQNRNYAPSFAPDAPLHTHLRYLARTGMGLTLHCDVSNEAVCIRTGRPGRAENLADLDRLFGAHPDNTIVWAHLGGLGKHAPPPPGHVQMLRRLLAAHPRLHIDLSWDVVASYYSPNPQPARNLRPSQRARFDAAADAARRCHRIDALAQLIEDFPDRFVMGSDALVSRSANSISDTYGIYANQGQGPGTAGRRGLFDRLQPDTLEAVLRGNFSRLYDAARTASRRYERQGLADDMREIRLETLAQGRTPNRWPPLARRAQASELAC